MPQLLLLVVLLASLTPAERRLRASIAGQTGWANLADRTPRARHASRGNWQKCYDATDPALPEHVRVKMADSAFHAHMKRLSLKSMKARRERKAQREREAAAMRQAREAEAIGGGERVT